MTTYRELLQQTRAEIDEINAAAARSREDSPLYLDVREQDEWDEGHIPGAVHVPRGNLESRIEALAPQRDRPIVVYCASGNRSVFATKTLREPLARSASSAASTSFSATSTPASYWRFADQGISRFATR